MYMFISRLKGFISSPNDTFFFFPCFFCGNRTLLTDLSASSLIFWTGGGSGDTDSCRFFSDISSSFRRVLKWFSLPWHSTFEPWRDTVTSWLVWCCFLRDLHPSSWTSSCWCCGSCTFLRGARFFPSLSLSFGTWFSCFRLSSDSCLCLSTSPAPFWWTPLTCSQPEVDDEETLPIFSLCVFCFCLAFSAAWKERRVKLPGGRF